MTESNGASSADRSTERRDADRERLFAELARTGSPAVREELILSFAPLAEFFAKRYRNRGAASEDLRQVAQLGLVKAVDRFDPEYGVQFSTFAGRTIDGELKRYFRDKTWSVRVPRSLKERSAELRKEVERFSSEHGRSPTVRDLVELTSFTEDEVIEGLDVQQSYSAQSIDRPRGGSDDEGGVFTIAATLGDTDRSMERAELRIALDAVAATLPEREQKILELRFVDDMSQSEIAERIGISQMHVSRLLRRSLEAMREVLQG